MGLVLTSTGTRDNPEVTCHGIVRGQDKENAKAKENAQGSDGVLQIWIQRLWFYETF